MEADDTLSKTCDTLLATLGQLDDLVQNGGSTKRELSKGLQTLQQVCQRTTLISRELERQKSRYPSSAQQFPEVEFLEAVHASAAEKRQKQIAQAFFNNGLGSWCITKSGTMSCNMLGGYRIY